MDKEFEATIGLEIHAELKTDTKMFCSCRNNPDEVKPNANICPVCLAHPGTLPVINKKAVEHVLRVGAAIGGVLADYTEFDRKNYFYPDLPKGYQISQFEFPLVSKGTLSGVAITRIHLEEDTASSIHDEKTNSTVIDFNRSSVPLMELVTEPVIRSAAEAASFARELQLLLRYLGVSDANMEKGEMRVEANISIAERGSKKLGTKVEIKNLNSFRIMERAVEYEIKRQTKVLKEGGSIQQETRGWDEAKSITFAQRLKEGSADYRYFPDPDLPSLRISEIPLMNEGELKESLPMLPWERRSRYLELGIKADDADLYVREVAVGDFVDAVIRDREQEARFVELVSNYTANDLIKFIRDSSTRDTVLSQAIPIAPDNFRTIIQMLVEGKISSRGGKDLLKVCIETGQDPKDLATKMGLVQDAANIDIDAIVNEVVSANVSVAAEYKQGKLTALEFLVGQCMKKTRGTANPQAIREVLSKILGA